MQNIGFLMTRLNLYHNDPQNPYVLQITLKTDDMDLAGDVVQALAVFLNLDDLQSTADFPHEMEKLREVLVKVHITEDNS